MHQWVYRGRTTIFDNLFEYRCKLCNKTDMRIHFTEKKFKRPRATKNDDCKELQMKRALR